MQQPAILKTLRNPLIFSRLLNHACFNGSTRVVEYLLNDPVFSAGVGQQPLLDHALFLSCYGSSIETVRLLVAAGADPGGGIRKYQSSRPETTYDPDSDSVTLKWLFELKSRQKERAGLNEVIQDSPFIRVRKRM